AGGTPPEAPLPQDRPPAPAHGASATTMLAKTTSIVVIEELNMAGLLKSRHLAQAIADVGFYGYKRPLTYTAAWYGARVGISDRWEPSSTTCVGVLVGQRGAAPCGPGRSAAATQTGPSVAWCWTGT